MELTIEPLHKLGKNPVVKLPYNATLLYDVMARQGGCAVIYSNAVCNKIRVSAWMAHKHTQATTPPVARSSI